MTLLWLDDIRDPMQGDWLKKYSPIGEYPYVVWIKSYVEFCDFILKNGVPDAICFDHDLGTEVTGYDAAKFLVAYCQAHNLDIPRYSIQSSNPVGALNISSLMKNYHKFYLENNQ